MSRTLIQTPTPGWFAVAGDPNGKKVRKGPDDEIVTLAEYRERQARGSNGNGDSERTPTQERAAQGAKGAHEAKAARKETAGRDKEADSHVPSVVGPTGKLLVGATTTIKCKWVPLEHQNAAVAKLYRVGPGFDQRKVTVAQVERAAGGHAVCGRSRLIKKQDEFQVFLCVEHQKKHRLQIKKKKVKDRSAAAKAARQKAA